MFLILPRPFCGIVLGFQGQSAVKIQYGNLLSSIQKERG